MASPLKSIQKQSNIITHGRNPTSSHGKTDVEWDKQQSRNYFQTPEPRYLMCNTETQLPYSDFKAHIILHKW